MQLIFALTFAMSFHMLVLAIIEVLGEFACLVQAERCWRRRCKLPLMLTGRAVLGECSSVTGYLNVEARFALWRLNLSGLAVMQVGVVPWVLAQTLLT